MSAALIEATALMCRLLEFSEQQINGKAVFEGEWSSAAKTLMEVGLLIKDYDLPSATCYDCWMELARVVDDPPKSYAVCEGQVLQMCSECGPIVAPAYVRQMYRLALPRLIIKLLVGLDFSPNGMKAIDKDTFADERAWQLWRLGTSTVKRGKGVTWYFGRQLH